jgi:exopolysaccharide production protein ExoZ
VVFWIKLLSLQYIRGIAALLVVLYHATNMLIESGSGYVYLHGIFQFGYMGVDIFFILSGFIIFYIHYSHIGDKGQL